MKYSAIFLTAAFLAGTNAQAAPWEQCGGTGAEVKSCGSGYSCSVVNEYYHQCVPGVAATTSSTSTKKTSTTTTKKPTSSTSKATTATTKTSTKTTKIVIPPTVDPGKKRLPAASGTTAVPTAIVIATGETFDGKMFKYERNPNTCQEQKETTEADASFILESGATIQNVIIGASSAEGIHCRGPCTVKNVWWEDVCEDAITLKQPGADDKSWIIGGGAFDASDKIVQFNGRGTVEIDSFYANHYGKYSRNCGTCPGYPQVDRHMIIRNATALNGAALCAVNVNLGDTCRIYDSCQPDAEWCHRYNGDQKIDEVVDNKHCFTTNVVQICSYA